MVWSWRNGAGELTELQMPNYLVTSYDGFSQTPVRLQTQKSPYQHGTTLIDTLLEPRYCNLILVIAARTKAEKLEKRRELIRAFSPRLGVGKLTWEQEEGQEYSLKAIAEEAPVMPSGAEGVVHQEVIVNFMAPDPTFYSPEKELIELDSSATARANVYNQGDTETPVFITVDGACEEPKITNLSTGHEIVLEDVEITAGERIEINTKYGIKKISHVNEDGHRSNLLGKMHHDSVLFYLQPGNNQIDFRSLTGEPMVEFEFNHRYAGI